jgi:hypothetical protein
MKVWKGKFGEKEVLKVLVKPKVVNSTEYQPKHHVHIVDRSGSMYSDIKNLIEDVKKTISLINEKDLLSVIWFSSENQAKILLQGANKNTPNLDKLLDSIASTVGCTCFSYPLELLHNLIEETKIISGIFNITLFTDGQPVVNWSVEKEEQLCVENLSKNKNEILAFNSIGYGSCYNEKFLKKLSSMSPMGRQFHATDINEYSNIWNNNYNLISNCVLYNLKIEADNSDIIFISNNEYNLVKNEFSSSVIGKDENIFYIITDNVNKVKINGEYVKSYDDFEVDDSFKFVLAYQYYSAMNYISALEILGSDLKDIYLTNKMINSFTYSEKQEMLETLKDAVLSETNRFVEGKSNKKLVPNKKAFCIFDLLSILYKNNCYYIPSDSYNKITASNTEKDDNFRSIKGTALGSFRTMSFNKSKLNISIDYNYEGIVKLDENDNINLPSEIVAKSFRKHTLIKDGVFNMQVLRCAVTVATLKDINKKYYDIVEEKEINGEKYIVVDIKLKKIPIINMSMHESSLDDIIESVKEMNYLKNTLKAIKKENKENESDVYSLFKDLSEEELNTLKTKYNISRQGWHSNPYKKAKKEELDFYEAREIEFTISDEKNVDISEPKEMLNRIVELESQLMGSKLAKVLTGTFWEDLKEVKTDKYEYNGLTVKTKKTKVYY